MKLDFLESFDYHRRYQIETYFAGDTINSKDLQVHRVVIDALAAALEGLTDRKRFQTYEQLDSHVHQLITENLNTRYAYWNDVHEQFMSEKTMSFPLGLFIYGSGYTAPLKGLIKDCQIIYICPFVGYIRYGLSLVVTSDGWTTQ